MPSQNANQIGQDKDAPKRKKAKKDEGVDVTDCYSRAGRATLHQHLPLAKLHKKKEVEKLQKAQGGIMSQKELIPGLNNMKERRAKLADKAEVVRNVSQLF